jgi:hypothetical protein
MRKTLTERRLPVTSSSATLVGCVFRFWPNIHEWRKKSLCLCEYVLVPGNCFYLHGPLQLCINLATRNRVTNGNTRPVIYGLGGARSGAARSDPIFRTMF